MKNRLLAALIVSTTMFPMLAFAQNEHISHEQLGVPAVQAQHDGTPTPSNASQPARAVATSATNSGYGNATATSSQSGSASQTASTTALYLHH